MDTPTPLQPSPAPAAASLRDHWQQVYLEKREDEVSWFQATPRRSLELIARTGAGTDASVVDVGGGASRLVDALLDGGYRHLTVLDLAAAALERARARLGDRAAQVTWVAGDVRTWVPEAQVDVWHDRAAFHFMVAPADRRAYLAALRRALRPGGHAIIGTFAADGPERCSGLPVLRWDPVSLSVELGYEFSLVECVREEHTTPSGKGQRFQFSRFVRD